MQPEWWSIAGAAAGVFAADHLRAYRRDEDDMRQIAALAAWKADARYNGETPYRGYIYTSCYRAMLDALRHRNYGSRTSRQQLADGEWIEETSIDAVEESDEQGEALHPAVLRRLADKDEDAFTDVLDKLTIADALAALTPRERAIIRAVDLGDVQVSVLARRMGVSERRVGVLRKRGHDKMRQVLRAKLSRRPRRA